MPSPTPQQQRAIEARGDVLVMAGAGAGKTSTMVARVLAIVLDSPVRVPLDRLLVVTFNEAAATEMRERLRSALSARQESAPEDPWVREQVALLETSLVSTLHAFCLRLIREHFHELGLDPQFAVQDEGQSAILKQRALEEVLGAHYDEVGSGEAAEEVHRFLERHARDGDRALRQLVLRIHDYARSLPEPQAWRRAQWNACDDPEPNGWRSSVVEGVRSWAAFWRPSVEALFVGDPDNFVAGESAVALAGLEVAEERAIVGGLAAILAAGDEPRFEKGAPGYRKKGRWRDPIKALFEEAALLRSRLEPATPGGPDPLKEDWEWARSDVRAVLTLVGEVDAAYMAARRAAAALDFADLEQLALQLLWDPERGEPTELARQWRERLEYVFVDEYQDINRAQDRILECVSRPGEAANRFFVGDVKQSIYRFRRADPAIFRGYAREWREKTGCSVVPLVENFRSHEAILGFVNEVFTGLMRSSVGGVEYDAEARLEFGAPEARAALREQPIGRVELHLLLTDGEASGEGEIEGEGEAGGGVGREGEDAGETARELDREEQQAALAAARLKELLEKGTTVWDSARRSHRPMTWRDVAVLHPAPGPVAERWARQFAAAGIPFEARRGGFFNALEVSDLIQLARLLDNPLQDYPALAVFRSPLVGLTVDELAAVRLQRRGGSIWEAAEACVDAEPGSDVPRAVRAATASARARLTWFFGGYERWRRMAREGTLGRCLEAVLADTSYEAFLLAQPRAEARVDNVRRLLTMARQFDQFQRTGLYRFLQYLDAQAAAGSELEAASAAPGDAVRFLSVHQSKGLEFPVVLVAGLGRRFNQGDLAEEWLLDEQLGICPPVLPPGHLRGYPSLTRWFAGRRQRAEAAGEQIRLFYVACTRAAERLLLVGTTRSARLAAWNSPGIRPTARDLVMASDVLGWLGPRLPSLLGDADWHSKSAGSGRYLDWVLHPSGVVSTVATDVPGVVEAVADDPVAVATLRQRLRWTYPYFAATHEPAKAAVTALRRQWVLDEEAALEAPETSAVARPYASKGSGASSAEAVERGMAHHLFFELMDLARAGTGEGVEAERERVVREGWMTAEQAESLDLEGVLGFWLTPLGVEIRAAVAGQVRREVPFTARLLSTDAELLRGHEAVEVPDRAEFKVVQGVVDLMVLKPDEIWVVDYKTDRVVGASVEERAEHYRFQLRLYAHALTRIYRRPVTRLSLWFVEARRLVDVG